MKTAKQIEKDYRLAKELQKIGYIKTDWRCPPEKLCGELILKSMKERRK